MIWLVLKGQRRARKSKLQQKLEKTSFNLRKSLLHKVNSTSWHHQANKAMITAKIIT